MAFSHESIEAPLIIGHRGAAGLVPENTLPGFLAAVELGVDAVELDVHLCEDHLVVIHDETLERTTNGRGPVTAATLNDLRQLDAGRGAAVPLLDEVLDTLPEAVGINIELKGSGTATALVRLLRARPVADLLVSSFDHQMLKAFRDAAPNTLTAPLFGRWQPDVLEIGRDFGGPFINLGRRIATEERIEALCRAGFQPLVYTVNDPREAARLIAMGVAGLFTDYPDRIMASRPLEAR